jgi:ubiquinone/menaquinone biosynthesis C-methylase UbiE
MPEYNLLGVQPVTCRDVSARLADKAFNRKQAVRFDWAYFDGPREQGYGGYVYDGRWKAVARRIIERYGVKPGDRLLDIGCAKGFLMKDLQDALSGVEVVGLDISDYAIRHCHPDVRGKIVRGSCDRLPWPDGQFAAAVAINTLHNLPEAGCRQALRELARVAAPGKTFVQLDTYRNDEERELFEAWMLTAETYCRPEEWARMFENEGYAGDYFWTILNAGTTV